MSGQNICSEGKLCWEATICRLCPDAMFHRDEIYSVDDKGVTVGCHKIQKDMVGTWAHFLFQKKNSFLPSIELHPDLCFPFLSS